MPAWRLEIGDDCAPQAVLRDASDDLLEAVKDGDAALTVKLHIANGNLKSGESDGGNAYATVMLEGKDDDHRLSASRNRIKLVNGSHSVTIPLARANWTDASGNTVSGAQWNALLANLGKIGIALGGEKGEAEGVAGSGGLFLIAFKVE